MTNLNMYRICEMLASDTVSEACIRDKHNAPDFLRFKPEIQTVIRNTRSHLSFLKLLGKKMSRFFPFSYFLGLGGVAVPAHVGGIPYFAD